MRDDLPQLPDIMVPFTLTDPQIRTTHTYITRDGVEQVGLEAHASWCSQHAENCSLPIRTTATIRVPLDTPIHELANKLCAAIAASFEHEVREHMHINGERLLNPHRAAQESSQ